MLRHSERGGKLSRPKSEQNSMRPRQLEFRSMPSAKEQAAVLEAKRRTLEKELALTVQGLERLKSNSAAE